MHNQSKRKLTRDENGDWVFEKQSTGKLDQFPLADESKRVLSHTQSLDQEESVRLLLNPCCDKPQKHLRFDTEGQILSRQIQGQISEMAKVSIGVYALTRTTLNEARKAKYLDMVNCWQNLLDVDDILATADPAQGTFLRRVFERNEAKLRSFVEEGAEFSAMATLLSKKWFKELKGIRERLDALSPP